ncbi:MAG: hypothetical protein H0T76_21815 [Nannocystis sp.]|nr:hypothetical protein [Nannocystis sp.]MBA3549131.1 hypothetical protein [Nannocystis sp.]
MRSSNLRTFTVFSALLTGLLGAVGCNEDADITDRYAAFTPALEQRTPDPVAGMALALGSQHAELELADGVVIDLELGDAEGEDLLGACDGAFSDGDRTLLPVLNRPLVVGDRSFAEPVLEAGCHAETASNRLTLREASDVSCADGECLDFATPETIEMTRASMFGDAEMDFSAGESEPLANHCAPVGTRVCVSCGAGRYRPRTVTSVFDGTWTQPCQYTYSYGTCSTSCSE